MFKVYVLQSKIFSRYYIGHTQDIEKRLKRHNKGFVRSTKPYLPWEIVYTENFRTKRDACRRELKIKSYKNGGAFKRLIKCINDCHR